MSKSSSSNPTTCTYKGRTYRLTWIGVTKFGRKAKLQFMDGSNEFWVAADLIDTSRHTISSDAPPAPKTPEQLMAVGSRGSRSSSSSNGPKCADCGRGGKLVRDLEDGLMKHKNCCDMPPG